MRQGELTENSFGAHPEVNESDSVSVVGLLVARRAERIAIAKSDSSSQDSSALPASKSPSSHTPVDTAFRRASRPYSSILD